MHMGAVSAELGLGGWPSLGESLGVARELSLAADTGQPLHLMHLSARESVELLRSARESGVERERRGHAAPPLPHRRGAALARPEPEDESAAAHRRRPRGADRGARATGRSRRSPPTTRRTRARRRTCPSRRRRSASPGLETAFASLYTSLVEPGLCSLETLLERMSAGPGADLRARAAADRGRRAREPRPARPPRRAGRVREDGFRSRSANSWLLGQPAARAGAADGGRRPGRLRGMTSPRGFRERLPRPRGRRRVSRRERRRNRDVLGEAVFTTAMTGYQEVATDPSFCGQVVCFTAPMVGNYGVAESPRRVAARRTPAAS